MSILNIEFVFLDLINSSQIGHKILHFLTILMVPNLTFFVD